MMSAHRPVVMGSAGMVASGHPLASLAGADMLRQGGNAVDAAVASAAALAVAIPHMNGIGGDAIGLVHTAAGGGQVTAVNGSGVAPEAADPDRYRSMGHESIPRRGPLSISVPGVVQSWGDCLERWGTRSLGQCLEFAIGLAETGVPLDQGHIDFFAGDVYAGLVESFPELSRTFFAPGHYAPGLRLKQPMLARTLRCLATDGVDTFYRGEIARRLANDLHDHGALLTAADLGNHRTLFQQSLSAPYRDRDVHVAPPNSQGVALALLLGMTGQAGEDELDAGFEPAQFMALKRAAFELRDAFACDPARSELPEDLLEEASLRALATGATTDSESEARGGGGDTSTLVVMDAEGNAVSWVQSLFEEFGSGVVSESTGVVLHNRLSLERLDGDPVHGLKPGLRPFHTLCPALVTGRAGCEMVLATPGDHGQPQTLYQVLRHVYESGLSVQEAIEYPRIRHDRGREIMIESRCPAHWSRTLEAAGYEINDLGPWARKMGGVNAIRRTRDGVLMAGADPRRSAYAIPAGI